MITFKFPSLAKEGWTRHQENGPLPLKARPGWFVQQPIIGGLNQPPRLRPLRWLRGIFLMGADTPPWPRRGVLFALCLFAANVCAQGPRGGPPRAPKDAAPFDMTGYWVAVVSEDWRFRMFTPPKGDYPDIPLNQAGKNIADSWDPAKDEAAGEQCKAYGAANIFRIPTRLHLTWADNNTLKIETDAGTQTRVLRFGAGAPPLGPPDWQGFSVAQWEGPASGRGSGGGLKVITTRMRPGYLQKNGAPYGANAQMTEYFDVVKEPDGDQWLVVKSIVVDPQYLQRSLIRST